MQARDFFAMALNLDDEEIIEDIVTGSSFRHVQQGEILLKEGECQQEMLFLDYIDLADAAESDAGFYLNGEGQVVLVFPEYSLGAGALGTLEFPLHF